VSPDGREIAFSRSEEDGAWHIWTIDVAGGSPRRLTAGEAGEVYSRYSPDGASVWFHTWIAPRRIGRVPSHGGPLQMVDVPGDQSFGDLSPDGKTLAFTRADADSERVYLASVTGQNVRALTRSPGTVPRWSPDGSLIAYAGDRAYSGGIFLIRPDGTSQRRLTSEGGWPVWWPGGRELGYLAVGADGNQEIRVASLDGSTRTLTSIRLNGTNHPFAVFPDGKRIVASNAVHVSDEIWLLEPGR
jgi:TolB protein